MFMAPNYSVAAVEKAIRILNYLAEHPNSTFSEIHTALGLSKSTTYQTLFTLESYQYVVRTAEKKYQLDMGIISLVRGVLRQNDLVSAAREPLKRLADETGLTVLLCALEPSYRPICLFKIDGVNFTSRNTAVGREMILHTSAAAKALLAWLPQDQLLPYLNSITYEKFTETTITSPVAFRQELMEIQRRGYSVDNCEGNRGSMGIGVPILDDSGKVLAAISIGAIITEIPPEEYPATAAMLHKTAEEIFFRIKEFSF